jgi:flagellar biosynthetic protein FliQ
MQDGTIALALREALWLAIQLGGPPLLASLATGLVVSVLQAVTQINEASLVFLPKIAVVVGVLLATSGFMIGSLEHFSRMLFAAIMQVGGV